MAPIIRICSLVAALSLGFGAAPASARDPLATYVHARAADAAGDGAAALTDYAAALTARPNAVVALPAYRAAVTAGDFALALRAIAVLDLAHAAPADAAIVLLADAIAHHRRRQADAALDRLGAGPFDFIVPIVRAWQARDRAKGDPFALLSAAASPLSRRYANEARALLLIADRQYDAGIAATQAQTGGGESLDLRWNAAQLLAGAGQRDRARQLLGTTDPGRGVKPSLAFGTARLLLRIAFDLAEQAGGSITVTLARAAVLLEPGNDRGRTILADALIGGGADGPALRALAGIRADSPFATSAVILRSRALTGAGDPAAALDTLRAASADPRATEPTIVAYGDYLVEAGRFDDAAAVYRRPGGEAGALPELRIADALDKAGRWAEAKPHFDRALMVAPTDAAVLNAVGYARLEHRDDIPGTTRLLEQALATKPDDGAIVDSVGYAYLLSGDAARALPLFERAARSEQPDPVIMEHLGDAYWAAGRRYEARFAWRSAATNATVGAAARLAERIERGPPPAP